MTLPDGLRIQQPLLHRGIITVPKDLDGNGFRQLSWSIDYICTTYPNEVDEIVLRINGPGGDQSDMFACVDLIRVEGQSIPIHGYLYGEAASAHSVIWAACPRRTVLPNAALAVHSCQTWFPQSIGGQELQRRVADIDQINQKMAAIYADACAAAPYNTAKYWMDVMNDHSTATLQLMAKELVGKYKMAKAYKFKKVST